MPWLLEQVTITFAPEQIHSRLMGLLLLGEFAMQEQECILCLDMQFTMGQLNSIEFILLDFMEGMQIQPAMHL
jgi:hypothetical protein